MNNPYRPPQSPVEPPIDTTFRWQRILVWTVLIYIVGSLVGLVSGLTMARWEIYGSTIDEAVANSRLVRRLALGAASAVMYWWFAAPLDSRRLVHVVVLFCVVQLLDAVVGLIVFQVAVADLFNAFALARALLAAAVGFALAHFAAGRKSSSARSTANPPEVS